MGKRLSFQQVLLGNLDSCMQSNETKTHPHTMHKNKLKWLKDINIRQDIIELLEKNTSKTFSYINLTNVFSGQSPKATEIKAKKQNQKLMGPNQTDKLLHSKGNHKKTQKDNLQNGRK